MEIPPMNTVNLCSILSESKRIVKANFSHFFALSLFFLPLSLSLVITPSLHLNLSHNFFTGDLFHHVLPNNQKVVLLHLLYILIVYILTLCAIGTISYSTYNFLIGKPANYIAALKSLTFSFFPLVSTTILAHTIMFLVSLTFLMFVGVIVMLEKSLGFIIDYNSIYIIVVATFIVTIIYLQMNWCLAPMVVVAESKWGFEALMRSWYLLKGMRSVSLSLLLYFFIGNGVLAWISSNSVNVDVLRSFTEGVVLFTMLGSLMLMMCFVASTAANSVLYMNCKAFNSMVNCKGLITSTCLLMMIRSLMLFLLLKFDDQTV